MEKNYITPRGFRLLQQELHQLKKVERPKVTETVAWAAANGDRSENGDYIYGKKRLRQIDSRIRFLSKRLETAEIIDPASLQGEVVQFGATVTVLDEDDKEHTYTIVGVDEADPKEGRISWRSPVAAALLRKRPGEVAEAHSPQGVRELEVLSVQYGSQPKIEDSGADANEA